ncbi:DUF4843 domain-containing protein [Chitinophaga costaii]|nr:DUF4843 domain-containing protein [Chitinophaga costaii]
MKKLLICGMICAAAVMSACKKDTIKSLYTSTPGVYFDWSDSTGTDASRVDSLVFSFALTPDRLTDTALLPVRISGDRMSKDRYFKLALVDTATTAISGLHFKALETQYTMPADSGMVHVPVYLYANDTALHSKQVRIRIQLVPTSDFTVTDSSYNVAKIIFSNMLTKPTWWDMWGQLGEYSRVKYELFILTTGVTVMTPPADFNNQPAMMYALSTFTSFLQDPFSFVRDHPALDFTLEVTDGGAYNFYKTYSPEKKYLLSPDASGIGYHFHDENGNPI